MILYGSPGEPGPGRQARTNRRRMDAYRVGVVGGTRVVDELSKLGDSYHVFWDVRVVLPDYAWYRGKKNLKSAYMDLVVACPKGVFLLEVKNWSDGTASNPKWNPHEQTERAGKVLWTMLQGVIKGMRVNNVLVSVRGNMLYDPDYRVFVTDPGRVVGFLEDQPDVLGPGDLGRVVEWLRGV